MGILKRKFYPLLKFAIRGGSAYFKPKEIKLKKVIEVETLSLDEGISFELLSLSEISELFERHEMNDLRF